MNCKDTNRLLAAYLDGEVSPEEREQIEAHLSLCLHCQHELEVIAATQGQLRQALKAMAGKATPSPKAWVGIKQRLEVEERLRVTTWGLAKSKLKGGKDIMIRGLVSRQPMWKMAVAGVLAVALVAGLAIAIPSFTSQSAYVKAEDIAQDSREVQAALGGEVTAVKVVRIVDDTGTVICEGMMGKIVAVEIDLEAEKVIEVLLMPEFTEAEEQEAVNIAKADPRVQELMDQGATIGRVSPMYSFVTRVNPETGEIEEFSGALARVAIKLGEKNWAAEVDLTEGKVVRLVETTPIELPMDMDDYESYPDSWGGLEYFEIEDGPIEEPVFHLRNGGVEKSTQ